jgi:hypothetical protein
LIPAQENLVKFPLKMCAKSSLQVEIGVTQKSPFLTGFSTKLCGRLARKNQDLLAERRHAVCEENMLDIAQQLRDEIDPQLLEKHSATERVRDYPHPLVFWSFLGQVAGEDSSCARAVSRVQSWAHQQGLQIPSSGTGSFCEARKALPLEMLQEVHHSLCDQLDANLPQKNLWRGHPVKAEDGTTAQMPDTEDNRATYPYPSGSKPGCGFPIIRLGGLIDLGHGGLQDFSFSEFQTSELRGHDVLEGYLQPGDILAADRYFSSYEIIARLQMNDIHFVGRTHQARKIDFRKGRKLGLDERLQTYRKPRAQPSRSRLSKEEWAALPETMDLRIIRSKGPDREGKQRVRYVVTTLLDPVKYPAEEVSSLYHHRWEIEVRFRDIKTTLGMEMLRTKSPEMIRKEVLMHMIVYNLLRLLMLKAGQIHGVNHRRLSFKGALQVLEESRSGFSDVVGRPRLRAREAENFWERIAERYVEERPGRNEPRRVKRRPKCTRWLQKPRHSYFEHFRSDEPPLKILDQAA